MELMIYVFILRIYFQHYAYASDSRVADAVAEYFGGVNMVPPMINGSYGGQAAILILQGDTLVLNCTADYSIRWISLFARMIINETKRKVIQLEASIHVDQGVLKCVRTADTTLSASIKIQVQPQNDTDRIQPVVALRSSTTRIVTTAFTKHFSPLFVELRRGPSFNIDLISKWQKTFVSPVYGSVGQEMTVDVEYSTTLWTEINPSDNVFNENSTIQMIDWVPAGQKFRPQLLLPTNKQLSGGNHTLIVSDRYGNVHYSKSFEVILISPITLTDIRVYMLDQQDDPNKINSGRFANIVQQLPISLWFDLKAEEKYLAVCEFRGNPISPHRAFMYRNKYGCKSLILTSDEDDPGDKMITGKDAMSTDGSLCNELPKYGNYTLMPTRAGTGLVMVASIITGGLAMVYGCMYNSSTGRYRFSSLQSLEHVLLRFSLSEETIFGTNDNTRLSIISINQALDEIITGDNVIFRCIAIRKEYPLIFWKIQNRYMTYGDILPAGYSIKYRIYDYIRVLDLTIHNVTLDQSSTYTCRAQRSTWGPAECMDVNINLTVHEPVLPYFGPNTTSDTTLKVERSSSVTQLYCDARGSPDPSIKWIRDGDYELCGMPVCDTDYITISDKNRSISIHSFDTAYSGVYRCKIWNRLGNDTLAVEVDIVDPKGKQPVVLFISLAISTVIVLCLAILAIELYRRSKALRPLKDLVEELQKHATDSGTIIELNACMPTNEQIDALPFDFRYEIAKENLILSNQLLGSGAFGEVVVGYLILKNGHQMKVAVKSPIDGMNVDQQRCLLSEMKLMMYLGRHVNVVSLLGVMTGQMIRGKLYATLEYCEFGSLRDYLRQHKISKTKQATPSDYSSPNDAKGIAESVTDMDLLSYAYQVANGMSFLSSKNVVHRDLALRNVLLTSQHIVKIADFGLAFNTMQASEHIEAGEKYLPIKWMALEAITSGTFTKESDVWSFGIVMWELYSFGDVPYSRFVEINRHYLQWLQDGNRMDAPPQCPQEISRLMNRCWMSSSMERPTFDQCQNEISQYAVSSSPVYWERFQHLLRVMSSDEAIYYNSNQVISMILHEERVPEISDLTAAE